MKTAMLWFTFVLLPFVCFANGLDKTDKSDSGRGEFFKDTRSSFFQPISAGGWSIQWTCGAINQFHMKWKDGKVSSSDGEPYFNVSVDVSGFDFCVLPPEIKNFDDITKHGPYVWRHAKPSSASKIGAYDPKLEMVEQNQIILLRKQGKCLAIKPLEVTPVTPSWEETPLHAQYSSSAVGKQNYANMKLKKTDHKSPPNWKSAIFDWKRFSPADLENPPTQDYETSQGTGTAFLDTMIWQDKDGGKDRVGGADAEKFYIQGLDYAVAFSFRRDSEDKSLRLFYDFRYGEVSKVMHSFPIDKRIENVELSSCNFHELDNNGGGMGVQLLETLVFQLDDRYVAIQATSVTPGKSDSEPGTVAYKWRYWPGPKPETKLVSVEQNAEQQDAVSEEIDKAAGIKTIRLLSSKSFYFAGCNFYWDVKNPEDEVLTLRWEAKLKSVSKVGFALAPKEGQVREVTSLNGVKFNESTESYGSVSIKLRQIVAIAIDGKQAVLKLVKVERSQDATFVVYQWKPLDEAPKLTTKATPKVATNE